MAKKTKHKRAKVPNLIVIWEHIPDKDDEQALFMKDSILNGSEICYALSSARRSLMEEKF